MPNHGKNLYRIESALKTEEVYCTKTMLSKVLRHSKHINPKIFIKRGTVWVPKEMDDKINGVLKVF